MNLKNGKLFTSKFVGTGPSSFEKRLYRAAVSQSLRNTGLERPTYPWTDHVEQSAAVAEFSARGSFMYTETGIYIYIYIYIYI